MSLLTEIKAIANVFSAQLANYVLYGACLSSRFNTTLGYWPNQKLPPSSLVKLPLSKHVYLLIKAAAV